MFHTRNNNIVFTSGGRTKSMSSRTLLHRISVNFNLNPFAPKCQAYKINVNLFQTMKTTEYFLSYFSKQIRVLYYTVQRERNIMHSPPQTRKPQSMLFNFTFNNCNSCARVLYTNLRRIICSWKIFERSRPARLSL